MVAEEDKRVGLPRCWIGRQDALRRWRRFCCRCALRSLTCLIGDILIKLHRIFFGSFQDFRDIETSFASVSQSALLAGSQWFRVGSRVLIRSRLG